MMRVTNSEPIKQRAPVEIRAGEVKTAMETKSLSAELMRWCEIVCANNPPGQVLYVDPSVIEALNGEAQSTDTEPDENI